MRDVILRAQTQLISNHLVYRPWLEPSSNTPQMSEDGIMLARGLIIPIVLAALLCITIADAWAFDESRYPAWSGGWTRERGGKHGNWDPEKPRGLGQQAPLTPEYQAVYEASLADQERGGQGVNPGYNCQPHGM